MNIISARKHARLKKLALTILKRMIENQENKKKLFTNDLNDRTCHPAKNLINMSIQLEMTAFSKGTDFGSSWSFDFLKRVTCKLLFANSFIPM